MQAEQKAILDFLKQALEDQNFSQEEKYDLKSLLEPLCHREDLLSFARNQSFALCRDLMSDTQHGEALLIWLEKLTKTLDQIRPSFHSSEVCFSPGDACRQRIISHIHQAQKSIDVCVYTISDDRISEALIKAHERGCSVRVISDNHKSEDEGSDIELLARKGLPVRLDESPFHMHHKFAVYDQRVLINGSFNWTRSASDKNEENITVLFEQKLVQAFLKEFESLWERCSIV